jgi:4-amino-4-deoxy-L-arabinose transferase-like glycosyltransferase
MSLSARVFGFSSFSMLLPEAACTIAAVGLLYATVRRSLGASAGIIAGLVLALTPVTVAIGRVNNPDALLVLLLVGSAYLMTRALESGRTKHLVWCGALIGLAFMTKMLEGWMVAPALFGTYLLAGPPRLTVRLRQLAIAAAAVLAVSAAWPVAVSLWPSGSRPYIGGSTNESIWNLIFGYNGFGRLTGGGAGSGASFGGSPGILRMFNTQVGGQIAWLLPLAAVGLLAGLWLTRRGARTDRRRAALLLFGFWVLTDVAVFSSQKGIFHPYYVSALAPAVAALAGAGVVMLWHRANDSRPAVLTLVATLIGTCWLSVVLLGRTSSFAPGLRILIPLAAGIALLSLLALRFGRGDGRALRSGRAHKRLLSVVAVAGAVAVLAGPAAYSAANLGRSLSGNNVVAGPASATAFGGGGPASGPNDATAAAERRPTGAPPPGSARPGGPRPAGARAGAMGGGESVSSTLISYLKAHQGSAKYLVGATGSQITAPIIIRTGKAVVTIGGFNGGDPAPTVTQLAKLVAIGELRYVLVSQDGGGPGAGTQSLTSWVKQHGTAVKSVSSTGMTLYRVRA